MTGTRYRVVLVWLPPELGGSRMAYIADEEVVGRREYDRERGIRIIVPDILRKGVLYGEEGIGKLMSESDVTVLLIYGERAVEKAVSLGLADPDSVLEVGGLKHVIVYKFGSGGF